MCVSVLLFSLGDSHNLQVKGLGPERVWEVSAVLFITASILCGWEERPCLLLFTYCKQKLRAVVGTGTQWQTHQLKFPVWVFHMAEGRGQGLMLC